MTWISSVSRASVALLALFTSTSLANVTLPALFSEHAVLEKSARSVIWGQAEPGEQVTITLGSATARTQAGADGKWQTALDLRDQGAGPYELKVSGKNNLVVPDVVLGDVWICSGQSNMEFVLKNAIGAAEEIAQSANPMLRQFLVGRTASRQPLEQCTGHWVVAGPETSGGFTAVGYYFGKTLQKSLNVPIGLVHSSWGGTPCEAWTSIQGIDGDPDLKAGMERAFKTIDDFPAKKAAYIAAMTDWLKQHNREDHPADPAGFAAPAVSAAGWVPVPLPGPIAGEGLPPAGAFWLRKTVNLPPALDNKPLSVELENCNCFDTVYWNGEKFGATPVESYPGDGLKRRYNLPANLAKGGDNILAIRLFAPVEPPQITGNPDLIRVGTIALRGDWLAKAEFALPKPDAADLRTVPIPPKIPPELHNVATYLFNGMINPLLPMGIKGTIWYQGEANAGRAYQYRKAFPLMITDWRTHWQEGDFPFYFVQLASFNPKKDQPGDSAWAELREAQTMALALPNTGMATITDIGEANDIHPRDKKDVGERLAAIALARTYGKSVPFSGPMYESMNIAGNQVVLHFTHTDGGLSAKPLPATYVLRSAANQTAPLVPPSPGSQLQGFAICGADKKWHWADARIDGDTVIVSAPDVPQPIAVRYAWADDPTCNLFNGAGFPAVPFRTDDFPDVTRNVKY